MRSWRRLILQVPDADQEPVVALLHEYGTLGVASDEGRLIAYFPPGSDEDVGRVLSSPEIATLRVVSDDVIADERWHERWMERLEAFPVGERFVVVPVGRAIPAGGRIALRVTPGRAFGTGEHATTRLSLAMLEQELEPGDTVLDAGTGSGILAIAAHLLGARRVAAIDLDDEAVGVAARNAAASGTSGILFAAMPLEAIRPTVFDLVVANIDALTLIRVMPLLASMTRRALIVSGLLSGDEAGVARAARDAGLRDKSRRAEEDWVALSLAVGG